MTYKPVDTAITMVVGPCIDDSDFKSLEEAIAYNAAGMDVSLIVEKTDGTTAVTAITLTTAGTSDWTHKDGGYYEVEVTAAQNAEEGIAYVRGVCTGVLPFESAHYNVVKANVYDSWVKGTDVLQADITQLGGVAQSLIDLKDFADAGYDPATNKVQGVVLTDTTTTNTDMITGFATATALATLDTVCDGIQTDLSNGTDGLGALKALIDTVDGIVDAILIDTAAIDTLTKAAGGGDLAAIKAQVDAVLDLTRDSGVVSVTSAETTLFEDASPTKNKDAVVVKIDMAAVAAGDTFVVREKYKDESGGAYQQVDSVTYTGAQDPPLRIVTLSPYRYGAIITMQKSAGTDRSIEWESFVGE